MMVMVSLFFLGVGLTAYLIISGSEHQKQTNILSQAYSSAKQSEVELGQLFRQLEGVNASLSAQLSHYSQRDEYLINQELEAEIMAINQVYRQAAQTYELLLKAKEQKINDAKLEAELAKAIVDLAERRYASAEAKLNFVSDEVDTYLARLIQIPTDQPVTSQLNQTNNPPANGYRRQQVSSSVGNFTVDIVAADLNSNRVIVDTAAGGDCGNECPVLPLADYVSRNGAYAGINGSYFCPASYPSCVGKSNSFDTLLMNKDKVYFNSDNNVYSTVPAVIFGSGWVRFVGQSLEWGRDTSIDSMIANQPLLVSGNSIVFGGDGDPKKGSKSNRSFVASKGTTVYIGVVWNATVAESAHVLNTLGMEYGLNLDAGGSTALWAGGYKAGPGRSLPNAILFVSK